MAKRAKKKTVKSSKKKGLFDHLQAIYNNQKIDYWDKLEDGDRKSYSNYMINRLVSMESNFIHIVNLFQRFLGVTTERGSYLFYSQILPKGRRWNRYIKGNKEKGYPDWVIAILKNHYHISSYEVDSYLELYMASKEGKEELKSLLEMYGTEPKKIKSLRL